MTDEEMAEKYAKSIVIFDRDFHNDRFAEIEQAYLAGLKAGRTKWHKVAGGDLPLEDTKVLALMASNEICIAHFYRKNVWDKIGTVIAWCEMPEYTEE